MTRLASLLLIFKFLTGAVMSGNNGEKNFVIQQNQSASQVIVALKQENLIKNVTAAKLYLKIAGFEQNLRPGAYVLSPSQNIEQIFKVLTSGPKDIWVTIPEGFRREQIAARLGKPDFVAKTATLEGKLFPDTYLLPTYINTDEIIQIMTSNFKRKVGEIDNDTLILASLVERESRAPDERPIIAGILQKRLEKGWPLQVDATIQYAKGDWKPIFDTKYPSIYNTYLRTGLPPTPICNPGLSAIKAAQNPLNSPYWFYLHDAKGDVHFAKTIEEHNLNVDKYLKP